MIVSASPVRCNMKSCGRIATDSSHIENAQRICSALKPVSSSAWAKGAVIKGQEQGALCLRWEVTDLAHLVFVGEYDGQNGAPTQQVLDLEGVQAWVLGGLVVGDHQVDGVRGRREEEELEGSVPCGMGECPEDVCAGNLSERLSCAGKAGAHQGIVSRRLRGTGLAI